MNVSSTRSLDYLIERIWEELSLVKVYTKKRGAHPDLTDPICLRKGANIEVSKSRAYLRVLMLWALNQDFCLHILRMFAMAFIGL